jgi:hypothetical protein
MTADMSRVRTRQRKLHFWLDGGCTLIKYRQHTCNILLKITPEACTSRRSQGQVHMIDDWLTSRYFLGRMALARAVFVRGAVGKLMPRTVLSCPSITNDWKTGFGKIMTSCRWCGLYDRTSKCADNLAQMVNYGTSINILKIINIIIHSQLQHTGSLNIFESFMTFYVTSEMSLYLYVILTCTLFRKFIDTFFTYLKWYSHALYYWTKYEVLLVVYIHVVKWLLRCFQS